MIHTVGKTVFEVATLGWAGHDILQGLCKVTKSMSSIRHSCPSQSGGFLDEGQVCQMGSPVLLLWGQTACMSPSCVLFPASAFVCAVTIWSSTQSSQHTASSHSHLEHCQRDLELSLCAPQGLMFLGRDLSPFLL